MSVGGKTPIPQRRLALGSFVVIVALMVGLMPAVADDGAVAGEDTGRPAEIDALMAEKEAAALADMARAAENNRKPMGFAPCVQGLAGGFPCHQVDLQAYLPPDAIGGGPGSVYGGPGNDSWGWTDPETGKEWALMGRTNGTSFIDISDPKRPVFVANLPRHQTATLWSDIKTYQDHAFVVAEGSGNGLQVFDLTRLRDIDYADAPVTVDADAHYAGFGNSHNLVINEDSGFAYPVGTGGAGGNVCTSSLHMVDIRDPKNPTYAGCYNADGYTHDAQCVNYHGPDVRYQGRELCFLANPSPRLQGRLTIVDVTDKSNPVLVSRTLQLDPYAYSHQGWLTEDHRYFLHDDESDNMNNRAPGRTRMRVFDVQDLENPFVQAVHHSATRASAHNVYVNGRYAYLANYFDGLRIADITKIDHPGDEYAPETPAIIDHQGITEVACFDTDPARNDAPGFGGTWSNYPFFKSGNVLISGFDGLWIVKPRLGTGAAFPDGTTNAPPGGQGSGDAGGGSAGCLTDSTGSGPGVPHPPGHED